MTTQTENELAILRMKLREMSVPEAYEMENMSMLSQAEKHKLISPTRSLIIATAIVLGR